MNFVSFIVVKYRVLLTALILTGLLSGGLYYYYVTRYVELGSVAVVMPDLAPSVSVNTFVQPDFQRRPVQIAAYAVPGQYTVVVFRQQRCPDCRRLDTELEKFLMLRKDVAVRKIDLGEHWSSEGTLRDFGRKVWWTPFVVVYGPDATPLQADDGGKRDGWKLLNKWIAHELGKTSRQAPLR